MTFGDDGKITQIRQQWDQGALLKQIEIIGKMGRNWPIKDSREQIAMIQSCLKASGKVSASAPQSHNDVVVRTRGNSNNALRDPHASLQLFGNREELEAVEAASVVSPYAGNRPRQRGFTEILGDEPHDDEDEHRQRSMSPTKVGGGKNFQPMRIFDGQEHREEEEEEESPKRGSTYIRPNPRKYEHFDFADGSDPQDHPERGVSQEERPRSKHDSQWSFNDFVTPHKPKPTKTYRHQDERHWDTEAKNDDEAGKPAGKGRRDAETHFELQDDGERLPHQDRPGTRPRGAMHNEGLGLYKNKLFDQEAATPGPKRALGNITNLKDRDKDFDAHFAMTDDSPAPAPHRSQNVPEARMKAVKMMDANWAAYDKSPTSQKENQPQAKTQEDTKIHIAGDGMGGKKGTDRDWLYGGAAEEKERIHIAGDGMGGKKGTDRNWLYGGNAEEELPKPAPSRKGNAAASQKSFWDF